MERQIVPLLDPRYPCHKERFVHFKMDEQMVEVRYLRHCPECDKEWYVTRLYRTFGGVRIDELEWKEVDVQG